MRKLELLLSGAILIVVIVLVAIGYNGWLQLIGSMAAGYLFGIGRGKG